MNIELSPRQSATVGVAITVLSAGVLLLVVFGLFLLFARFVAVFSSVFLPLCVAVILALVVRPIHSRSIVAGASSPATSGRRYGSSTV